MLLTVAGDRPLDVFVLLDEPLWRVLYLFHHLTEREQREALTARANRVDMGYMAAFAFNQPASLEEELRKVHAAIAEQERGVDADARAWDEARRKGDEMVAAIERGRVLSPGALVH